jgi:hypothetical protein
MASGSRLLKDDRFTAQAISQLLQATQRSESTKMAFITLPRAPVYPKRPLAQWDRKPATGVYAFQARTPRRSTLPRVQCENRHMVPPIKYGGARVELGTENGLGGSFKSPGRSGAIRS